MAKDGLLSIHKFDGDYKHWAMPMENLLRSKEWWNLIEEGVTEPSRGTVLNGQQRAELSELKLKDLRVKNYLFAAIDKTILKQILQKNISKELWDSMKAKFQGNEHLQSAQLQRMRKEIEVLEMKNGENVTEYFSRVMTVANDMRNLGEDMPDSKVVEKVLITEEATQMSQGKTQRKMPVWMQEYKSGEWLSEEEDGYVNFAMLAEVFGLYSVTEPASFDEAVQEGRWREAMDRETESIERNNTWELCVLPSRVNTIGVKSILKTKFNETGEDDMIVTGNEPSMERSYGVKTDTNAMNSLMDTLVKENSIGHAHEVFLKMKMKDDGCVPNAKFYSSLIHIVSKTGRFKDASEIFEDTMTKPLKMEIFESA